VGSVIWRPPTYVGSRDHALTAIAAPYFILRVPGAAQHVSGALQTRDRYDVWRSRISGAPLRAAPHPGNAGRGPASTNERLGRGDRFFVYILANRRNGTLYVGVTNDLMRRVAEHKAKLVPGFTRTYGVDKLVYAEEHSSILEARERERTVKRWRRAWKIELIEKLNPDWRDMAYEWLP